MLLRCFAGLSGGVLCQGGGHMGVPCGGQGRNRCQIRQQPEPGASQLQPLCGCFNTGRPRQIQAQEVWCPESRPLRDDESIICHLPNMR